MLKRYIYSLFLLAPIAGANGQSSFELEQVKLRELNLKSQNAAFLQKSDMQNLGETTLSYQRVDGDFKHPLLAKENNTFGFDSERYQNLNNWKLYGRFGLQVGTDKNVGNSTQLNPLRINPYIIVDSLSGDWNKQQYAIETKIASPLVGNFGFGLGLKYNTATGARQRDPRPQNTSNILELQPAISYALNEKNTLGLMGIYRSFVEDFSVSNINTANTHNMYKLIGVGEYIGSAPIFISTGGITRRYEGNLFGGGVQYTYTQDNLQLLGETYVHINEEKVIDGTTNPQNAGKHRYTQYGLNLGAAYTNQSFLHRFNLAWDQKDIDNTEYHQYQDATTRQFVTLFSQVFNTNLATEASFNYTLSKRQKSGWLAGAEIRYTGWDNRYSVSTSQQTVDRLTYAVQLKKYVDFDNTSGLSIALEPSYVHTVYTKFAYDEKSYATNFVAKNILYPTNAFLDMNHWNVQSAVQYNFKRSATSGTQFYVKLSESLLLPTQSNAYFNSKQSRFIGQLAVGLLSF